MPPEVDELVEGNPERGLLEPLKLGAGVLNEPGETAIGGSEVGSIFDSPESANGEAVAGLTAFEPTESPGVEAGVAPEFEDAPSEPTGVNRPVVGILGAAGDGDPPLKPVPPRPPVDEDELEGTEGEPLKVAIGAGVGVGDPLNERGNPVGLEAGGSPVGLGCVAPATVPVPLTGAAVGGAGDSATVGSAGIRTAGSAELSTSSVLVPDEAAGAEVVPVPPPIDRGSNPVPLTGEPLVGGTLDRGNGEGAGDAVVVPLLVDEPLGEKRDVGIPLGDAAGAVVLGVAAGLPATWLRAFESPEPELVDDEAPLLPDNEAGGVALGNDAGAPTPGLDGGVVSSSLSVPAEFVEPSLDEPELLAGIAVTDEEAGGTDGVPSNAGAAGPPLPPGRKPPPLLKPPGAEGGGVVATALPVAGFAAEPDGLNPPPLGDCPGVVSPAVPPVFELALEPRLDATAEKEPDPVGLEGGGVGVS